MAVSKADLLKKRFGVEDVEIPGVGTVQVRPLSRAEALEVEGKEMSAAEMDRKLLAFGLVEPKLTEDEVAELQANTPAGLMQPVVKAIVRMSGMEQTAPKEAVKQFRG
jgi:hypothetical protein